MPRKNIILHNNVRHYREKQGWSQQELADRVHISRAGISAVEAGRLVPSTATALALAAVFGCAVEELFHLRGEASATWAWPPPATGCRYWCAEVGLRHWRYPLETSLLGTIPHDGILRDGIVHDAPVMPPSHTLMVAGCDPAAALLAGEYARQTGFRMLVLTRSSHGALELLAAGKIHCAGLHPAQSQRPEENLHSAAGILARPFHLLRLADWSEGLALAPGLGKSSVASLFSASLNWIGREEGSVARRLLDELADSHVKPAYVARDHRGVAAAIQSGFAQAGIAVQLVCAESQLDFIEVRSAAYDVCIPDDQFDDPRLSALIGVVRSPEYRRLVAQLPGYSAAATGQLLHC